MPFTTSRDAGDEAFGASPSRTHQAKSLLRHWALGSLKAYGRDSLSGYLLGQNTFARGKQ